MTIGNLSSKIRQKPSTQSILMVALLSIPIKNCKIPQKLLDDQGQTNREVQNRVLRSVLQVVTLNQNPRTESWYHNILWADGNLRGCKRVLTTWLTNWPEYSDLHHLKRHVGVLYRCPNNELGHYVPADKQQCQQKNSLYRTIINANTMSAAAKLSSCHVNWGFNVFWHIPCIGSHLPNPNLLNTMLLGMLDHLQKWIFHFMKTQKLLDKFNAIWLSMPAEHNLTPKNNSYKKISRWNGKGLKEISWKLLGVVTQSLRRESPAQRPVCNREIGCTWALLEFYMYARYNSHNVATSSYMETPCFVFTPSKMISYSGELAKRRRTNPIPWERSSWTTEK